MFLTTNSLWNFILSLFAGAFIVLLILVALAFISQRDRVTRN